MIRSFFNKNLTRKEFIRYVMLGAVTAFSTNLLGKNLLSHAAASNGRRKKSIKASHDLVLGEGNDPVKLTKESIKAIGGMERFVSKGDTVVIKPNIGWDRLPEYAANTNPLVVGALVELCYQAGAKKVKVFDRTCNAEGRCYENSGIKKEAEKKGAAVYFVDDWNFINARFDYESPMEGWPIFRDAIECDTFINVPILKHHGLSGLTLSMKNLMGICGGNRSTMHQNIGKMLLDLTDFISPELTVIDAFRVLTDHGPSGGDLKDVVDMRKIIVSTDPALADSYACFLMNRDIHSIPNISEAIKRNFGRTDITKADILKISA